MQHFSHRRRERQTTDRLVQVRSSIAARPPKRKEKAAVPEPGQAVRLVFFARLSCILIESASHFFDRFAAVKTFEKTQRSHFDKFNHVKYTKTLSTRNWRTLFSRRRCAFEDETALFLSNSSFDALFCETACVRIGKQKAPQV
ncbi:hypothetical protein [Massilia horti]|uniref:Uncharacterized protein n=1 Tax=Massilia horti TaxID=2562153 RepID=A0A4Y9T2K5_9BURK|nr:hypothetical protein [Massilia horti]TFW34033.1 hypothetical protein E4O92_05090 [Massilia horti]